MEAQLYSTLSENIEGSEYKEGTKRNEMFSSKTDGPFMKRGNVVFGAHAHSIGEGYYMDSNVEFSPRVNDTDQCMQKSTIDISPFAQEHIKQPIQTGAGKGATSSSGSKRQAKSKKKTQAKSKKTKQSASKKSKKASKNKKPSTKKGSKKSKPKSKKKTTKKTSKKKSTTKKK